jgi:hypothetical protein
MLTITPSNVLLTVPHVLIDNYEDSQQGRGGTIMPEQDFALDAAGNSVHVLLLDEPEGALVGMNRHFIGGIPSREALRAGQAFVLQDGSTLRVQLI